MTLYPELKQDGEKVPEKHVEEDFTNCTEKETVLDGEKNNFLGEKTKVITQEFNDKEREAKRIAANKVMAANANSRKQKRVRKERTVTCTRCDEKYKTMDSVGTRCEKCLTELASQVSGR